ncbi:MULTISPECIES: GMC oxidoreductase [unclassified Streptomyces]|uniref:GMC oxidoreductase n=1 Tax=unclassified Streptomyces TaxID=2593676 RepID=UPI00365E64A9
MGEPIAGKITDHHCIGVVSGREESSLGIGVNKPMGYLRWPDLRCNVFVQEELLSHQGGARRIVDAWALAEQDLTAGSPFAIQPASTRAGFGSVAIDTHISVEDRQRLGAISQRLNELIRTYPGTMSGEDVEVQPHYHTEPSAMRRVIDGSAAHLHYRIPLGSVDHEAGTLPMGELVDADLGLTGFDGIYVLGPGVFPASGAANPSLTSLALSNWLAKHLISNL